MFDVNRDSIIRKIELFYKNRYITINGQPEELDEVDMVSLRLYLGQYVSPYTKSNYVVTLDLMYISEVDKSYIENMKDIIVTNIESKILNENLEPGDVKVKMYKHKSKLRLSPKITKKLRKEIIDVDRVAVTSIKYEEMKEKWLNNEITLKVFNKYQNKPILSTDVLLN